MTENKKKVAISIGDLNGIGIELAFKCHKKISKICKPIYCINNEMLNLAAKKLKIKVPKDFELFETLGKFDIEAGKKAGAKTVAVATGSHSIDVLAKYKPDFIFQDFSNLESFLQILS